MKKGKSIGCVVFRVCKRFETERERERVSAKEEVYFSLIFHIFLSLSLSLCLSLTLVVLFSFLRRRLCSVEHSISLLLTTKRRPKSKERETIEEDDDDVSPKTLCFGVVVDFDGGYAVVDFVGVRVVVVVVVHWFVKVDFDRPDDSHTQRRRMTVLKPQ